MSAIFCAVQKRSHNKGLCLETQWLNLSKFQETYLSNVIKMKTTLEPDHSEEFNHNKKKWNSLRKKLRRRSLTWFWKHSLFLLMLTGVTSYQQKETRDVCLSIIVQSAWDTSKIYWSVIAVKTISACFVLKTSDCKKLRGTRIQLRAPIIARGS